MCDNRVDYYVPKGYDYKKLDYKCGSTGIHGEAVMCESCELKIKSGKMSRPGYCPHGLPMYDEYDRDIYPCSKCC